jgi:allantoin racemase
MGSAITMPRILIINPNTSESVTERVQAACQQVHPDLHWESVTARFGAPYIASEASYVVGAHAVLEAYAAFEAASGRPDAALIACFGDPGLLALREVAQIPVVGLAQASLEAAAARGPFAVVTGGAAWGPMLQRFARMHQLDARLCGIHTVELTGAQIAQDPEQSFGMLAEACRRGIADGAQQVVLGGAGLAGLAARLQAQVPVPLLDNVLLGAAAVVQVAGRGATR